MKKITLVLKSLTLIFFLIITGKVFSQSTATYTITFTSTWDSVTNDPIHGNSLVNLPANAHWSDLVGVTHNSAITLLEMGNLASLGVKNVAEAGVNIEIMNEVQAFIGSGNANQFLQASFDQFAPRTSATLNNITVSETYPLLSLVSMIAPSPDWMIAINSVNLREGGLWTNEIIIPLFPYDAGTDSGSMYTSADQPTLPNPEPISVLVNQGPFNAKPIGTLTITLNEVLSLDNQENTKVVVSPNPSNGIIKIKTSSANKLKEALVFDILGKQVATVNNKSLESSFNLNLTTLNKGIYVLKMQFENNVISSRKIVIH